MEVLRYYSEKFDGKGKSLQVHLPCSYYNILLWDNDFLKNKEL